MGDIFHLESVSQYILIQDLGSNSGHTWTTVDDMMDVLVDIFLILKNCDRFKSIKMRFIVDGDKGYLICSD